MNDNMFNEELQVKFAKKKVRNMRAFEAMSALGLYDRALRMMHCGSHLKFKECPSSHYRKLVYANFCRDRMCPMCSWRRSRLLFGQILTMLHVANERETLRYLFLTLTVRNCKGDDLPAQLDVMYTGFKQLMLYDSVKSVVVGWVRNLEITYNEDTDEFHPHFHVLIAVRPSYFNGANYISQKKWTSLWQRAANLSYPPIVNIKRVKPKRTGETIESAVAETAKYSVKDSDYLKTDMGLTIKIMSHLIGALKGRQLIGFGMLFYKLRRELKQIDIEKSDLVEADGKKPCDCPICQSTLIDTLYTWNYATSAYTKHVKVGENDA